MMRGESWRSASVTWLDREGAVQAVRESAQRLLAERPEVRKVILFGSLARGDAVPGSDADVIVIAETDVRFIDRYLEYAPYFDQPHVDVQLLTYTPQEAARMVEQPGVVRTALSEGVVLAERTSKAE